MMRDVLDSAGEVITGLSVMYCRPDPEANVINTRLLGGGAWQTQTVGDPSWKAAVQLRAVGLSKLRGLQQTWATGASMTVRFDDMAYTGTIEARPAYELKKRGPAESRIYSVTFSLLIVSEEAVS